MAASGDASLENPKPTSPSFVPNCLFPSSPLLKNPFLKPIILPKPNLILRELNNSLTSTTEKCTSFLHAFASQNPVFKKIVSLSSDFSQQLAQIQRRKQGNVCCLSKHKFAAVFPGDSVAGLVVANGILNFLNIYNTVLVVRLVLTWFPNTPPAIVSPLSTLCDPYLNIFRGIIPPLGGTLDLSPILAFLVLNAFTSAAAALPAELPGPQATPGSHAPRTSFTNVTTSQEKWMRRLCGNKSKSAPKAA
ncbi:hypothetical protein Tsubulata_022457 [Turnera subulata]|uniref:YGGT family protein n=1 Tax=Turnera subulata TaxID=218843 RepID=A0A9Q0J9T1_9ROSI|nr:hypothetical protein Tsubulata_022457 [Turnera subulata]